MRRSLPLSLLVLSGCAADLTEAWEVKEPLLMGARVEVEGAPEKTRPTLTEKFSLRQYIALPGPLATPLATRYSMSLAVCLGFRSAQGDLNCLGEQSLAPTVTALSDTEVLLSGLGFDLSSVSLPMNLPPALGMNSLSDLSKLDRLALFGVLCVDGRAERVAGKTPTTDPATELFRCVDNAGARFPDPSPFTLSVLLDRGLAIDQNRNPSFTCDPAEVDSACALGVVHENEPRVPGAFVIARPEPEQGPREVLPWPARDPALPLPWQGCASDASLVQVQAGSEEHTLRVRFDPSDREQYQYEIESNGSTVIRSDREALLLSHALTTQGGELNRAFSKLFPDEPDSEAEISFAYMPPEQHDDPERHIPENGRLVRFYFTLRDERGGVDYTTRELCLVPGPQKG